MNRQGWIGALAVTSLALVAPGCDNSVTGACTLIACDDVIRVDLVDVPETFTITFRAEGEEPLVLDSTDPDFADDVVFIPDVESDRITVEVEADGVEFTETFDLEYETFRPNGPDCPPECRMATIEVDVDGES